MIGCKGSGLEQWFSKVPKVLEGTCGTMKQM